jgi:hypothetical protein
MASTTLRLEMQTLVMCNKNNVAISGFRSRNIPSIMACSSRNYKTEHVSKLYCSTDIFEFTIKYPQTANEKSYHLMSSHDFS